ncbi:unnamed protein product [Cylicocyclus nassatus]|uniref:Uncharacterized protein n=1 Tax=Cylicocyclus nassatus TaxID=53992 RepID=A0AA36M3F1_CYLNA|nr:unnamed protein product [Cylicocyclus nassatus]
MLCATFTVLIVSVLAAAMSWRSEADKTMSLYQRSEGEVGGPIDGDFDYYYPPCNDYDPCFGEKAAEYELMAYAIQKQVCAELEISDYYDAKPDCKLHTEALAILRDKSGSRSGEKCTLKLEGSYTVNGSTNDEKISRTLKLGSDRILKTIEVPSALQ